MSRTKIVAILAGLGIAGLVAASAATLGGLNAGDLGADVTVVASCDTDGIDATFVTEYSTAAQEYIVTDVALSDVALTCENQTLDLTLADTGGASVGTGSLFLTNVILGTQPFDVEITGTPVAGAEAAAKVAVVITGTPPS